MIEPGPVRKKRKGGNLQRIAAAEADDPSNVQLESALALTLIHMVVLGELSAPTAGIIAKAGSEDLDKVKPPGTTFPMLEVLCSTPRNVFRSMWRFIKDIPKLPPLHQVWLPMVVNGVLTTALAGILLPHEMFACLFLDYNATWLMSMVPGGADVCTTFWHQCRGHPALLGHPLHLRNKNFCVPIGIHIDEVPVTGRGKIWCKSSAIFSWFSLIGRATNARTLDSLFMIFCMYERLCKDGPEGTVDTFMAILYWSLMCLWEGVWPHRDWKGVRQHCCIQHTQTCTLCLFYICWSDLFSNSVSLLLSTSTGMLQIAQKAKELVLILPEGILLACLHYVRI